MLNLEIRQKAKTNDILEELTKLKWKWAGHSTWAVSRCTEWHVGEEKDRGEDQKEDGGMISNNGWELHGQEKQRTD